VKTILIAAVFSLLTSILMTPLVVVYFRRRGFGQEIRSDGPQTHLVKRGTPTMGGVAIIGSTVVGYVLAHVIIAIRGGGGPNASGLLALFLMVGLGFVGFIDDLIKIRRQRSLGLRARAKFGGQLIVGVAFAMMALQWHNKFGLTPASTHLSFVRDIKTITLGSVGFVILAYLIISATSNAVNLTDGLDGLAIMPTVMIASALAVFAYVSGNIVFARYLAFPYIAGVGELAIICGAISGAGLAFLWFNAYPAEVFMGDVGALALGAAIGMIALIVRQEVVLLIMGGVFVVETLSVMIQVASFKLTGKRVFRMAPLHHHYELKGWKENQVVVRFWIITMMLVLFGLSTLKLR
jgi:phospho-N-acetylmuramoyl-pentapeptide-transferase